jgi:chromatin structure-remodeling complex subunit RSC1/2
VEDVAQICHNAQVFNRPSAGIFGAAVRLREVFKKELKRLVDEGTITEGEAELPDLGEIPSADESLPPEEVDEREEDEDEEEEEDDEEEDDDADVDEDTGRRRSRKRTRSSVGGRKERDEGAKDDDGHKKRGRPPKVLTPLEARIHAVLKGLRKFKNDDDELLVLPFEKVPDKAANPDYYATISNPIALDNIKKKAKRKKYRSVDQVLGDLELMFENAKQYNEEGSDIYKAAVELQARAREIASQEKARPDDAFRDDDGKLPLSEIQHKGETWRVGDWVHIQNLNDLAKPIVAQIYRTWQDKSGEKWINACWYYRPEQTVHRFEKHFFAHEVVKTGQYRDHRIDEVVDRCYVMFVTRFFRGRPRGFPRNKSVYVCESRYNEEKYTFAKIKTWASCLPDEVREKDYQMDLFTVPHKMTKVPSPIKHLLRDDAKATDDFPKPAWGSPNAPPIVGAVHRRPREANVSTSVWCCCSPFCIRNQAEEFYCFW